MNTGLHRDGNPNIDSERISLAQRARHRLHGRALFFGQALMLALLLALSITAVSLARPTEVVRDEQALQESPSHQKSEAATDTALSSATDKTEERQSDSNAAHNDNAPVVAADSSESKGKLTPESKRTITLRDYQDPGVPQKKQGWFTGLIGNIIDVVKYVFYLAIVLAVGLLAIYGVKFFTTKYNALTGGHEFLNVLEVRYMAPGKALCLVEVANKVLVLGMTGNTITHLSDIDDTEQVAAIKLAAAKRPESLQQFQGVFEKVIDRFMYAPGKGKAAKSSRPQVPRRREPTIESDGAWQDDLHSTGDNIRKLLEDIKDQDKRSRGPKRPPRDG